MLDRETIEDIELIKSTAKQVWRKNVEFGEIKAVNSPYPEFEWMIRLYGQFDVNLYYDRSTLSIGLPDEEKYIALSRVTDKHVFRGFDGMKPENLLHNFKVLDDVVEKYKTT